MSKVNALQLLSNLGLLYQPKSAFKQPEYWIKQVLNQARAVVDNFSTPFINIKV